MSLSTTIVVKFFIKLVYIKNFDNCIVIVTPINFFNIKKINTVNLLKSSKRYIIGVTMEKELIEQNKEDFLAILTSKVKREGIDKFVEWLASTDFFIAPASTRYHLSEEGGLCQHSLNVYERLEKLMLTEYGEGGYNPESVAICGLLHDVCKTQYYKVEYRNAKEDGVWVQKPYYTVDDSLPYGHGEKSVYIINGYMRLTREEAMAINWHMGGLDARVQGGSIDFNKAYQKYPLALLTHLADMQATFLDESDFNE